MWTDPLGLYKCYYYIANRILVCEPDNPGHPWYQSANMTSGQNGPEVVDPARDKSYSECTDCANNPRRTNRAGRGPIPEGTYRIGPTFGAGHRRNLTPSNPTGRKYMQTHFCPNPATCSEGCIAFNNLQEFSLFNQMMDQETDNMMIVRAGAASHRR